MDRSKSTDSFNLDDDLRRLLKKEKTEILYTEITSIDFDEAAESVAEAEAASGENDGQAFIEEAAEATNTLEIGRTTLKIGDQTSSFLRVKFQ